MYVFEDICGNELIVKNLQNSIARGRISHAYIFDGKPGMGKMLLMKTLAKTLQCNQGGVTPCCRCTSCITFDSGNHPDIIYVLPGKSRSIGVDDIRGQVTHSMEVKPFLYPYKIFIIDQAHRMTPAAQNAMLKTIEEPAGYGVFLLSSQQLGNFLPTILSRTVNIKLKPLPDMLVRRYLIEREGFTEEEASVFSALSPGNIGYAIQLKNDENFMALREESLKTVLSIGNLDIVGLFAAAKSLDAFKDRINDFINLMYLWYRDLIVYKTTGESGLDYLTERDRSGLIKEEAARYSLKNLFYKLDALWQCTQTLRVNGNFSLAMDVLLLKLKEK